jgi:hypothetical protein
MKSILIDELNSTLCPFEEDETISENCAGTSCKKSCRIHLSLDSITSQRDPEPEGSEPVNASGFLTPQEPTDRVKSVSESPAPASGPSIEEMTKALLAGLKITPDSSAPPSGKKSNGPPPSSTEDISKSLLNLLHQSATKLRTETQPSEPGINQNVMSFFKASAPAVGSGMPAVGRSLSDLEASLKQQLSSTGVKSPQLAPKSSQTYSAVRVPLKVFTPFPGATPLCGLELRIDQLGYRVVRVTEKPGQDGNIREGDVITAIDGEPLVALPGISEADRERGLRSTFGKRLRDGVQLIIQRPIEVTTGDLNTDPNTSVERRLDFGLMLHGAGIDWRSLISKLGVAQQQATSICQTLGIEGKLEALGQGAETSPALVLRGPAGLVDKAMRQFCVVIVKAALLQQQQAQQEGKK